MKRQFLFCKYFDKNVSSIHATLGIEQEYFLIDSALFHARPDLMMTGRTVFGHAPAKRATNGRPLLWLNT